MGGGGGGGISNCNIIRHERKKLARDGRGGKMREERTEEWVERGQNDGGRRRENEAAGRRIKNAGPKGSRGFHLTE